MKNRVNWGILSTAHINRRIIPAIGQSPRANLRAVASRDANRVAFYSKQWDIKIAYGSYQELLDDPKIDVVYISLPNDLHAEWIIKAMQAGKNVLCEKPICLSRGEFDEIEKVKKETGCHAAEAFMYLHHPQTAFFRALIKDGAIGDLRSMISTFTATFSRGEDNYRLSNPIGGGSLWDLGVYPISFFQYLTGTKAEKCLGMGYPGKLDLRFSGMLQYPGGITGQFNVGFDAAFSTQTLLIGSTGVISISHPYTNTQHCLAWLDSGLEIKNLEVPRHSLYLMEIEDMNDVVLSGSIPAISLEDSRAHVETVLDLRASAGFD